jgi:hypothetical protein
MSYKDFEVAPRSEVEFVKSKWFEADKTAKDQINIRTSSRGQAPVKAAEKPADKPGS